MREFSRVSVRSPGGRGVDDVQIGALEFLEVLSGDGDAGNRVAGMRDHAGRRVEPQVAKGAERFGFPSRAEVVTLQKL